MNFVIAPNLAGGSNVSFFRRVDAGQDANAFPMFGFLADGDIHPVFIEHWCSVDFARTFGGWIFEFFPLRRITVIFPNRFEKAAVALFNRFGIEGVTKTVAAAEKNELLAINLRQ